MTSPMRDDDFGDEHDAPMCRADLLLFIVAFAASWAPWLALYAALLINH